MADAGERGSFQQWVPEQVDGDRTQSFVRALPGRSLAGALKSQESWGCEGESYTGKRRGRRTLAEFTTVLTGSVSVVLQRIMFAKISITGGKQVHTRIMMTLSYKL